MSLANRPTRSCGRGARAQALDNRVSAGGASQVRIQPFSVAVDAAVIGDMRARIRGTRLPPAAPGKRWAQGTDRDWLEGLLGYWADGFDWRAAERELNRFAHYRAQIGDAAVHFVHERARHGGGIPLVLGPWLAELLHRAATPGPAAHRPRPARDRWAGLRRGHSLAARVRVLLAARRRQGHLPVCRYAVAPVDA